MLALCFLMINRTTTFNVPCENIRLLTEPIVVRYFLDNQISLALLDECMGWLIRESMEDIFLCYPSDSYPVNNNYPVIYDLVKNRLHPQVTSIVDFTMFSSYTNVEVHCKYHKSHIVLTIDSHEF